MKTYPKSLQIVLFGIILLLGLYWIWISGSGGTTPGLIQAPQEGFLAPDFDLETLGSDRLSTNQLEGKAVILNFWASWCPPCRAEMPDFQQASQEYAGSDLLIIGINATSQDTRGNAISFLQENNITFPIALDPQGTAASDYQVHSLPTTFFIDSHGVIQKVVIGGPLPLSFLRIEAQHLVEARD